MILNWTNHKAALSLMYDGPHRLFTISYNVGFKPTQETRKAISNLVGAAPSLLEALEALLAHRECPIYSPEGEMARAAIQRAKGEQS